MSSKRRDIIVAGTSAGGVQALTRLLHGLPHTLMASIAVTMHRSPTAPSVLAELLNRYSSLPVVEPRQGAQLRRGCVYLAPRDHHMMIVGRSIHLTRSARQHHTRPAIDPLFQSAAESFGRRVIGVLLTGNLSDGVDGLIQIKELGGLSLVQDPGEAAFPSMPQNALIYDHVDLVFQLENVHKVLDGLVRGKSVRAAAEGAGTNVVAPAPANPCQTWMLPDE